MRTKLTNMGNIDILSKLRVKIVIGGIIINDNIRLSDIILIGKFGEAETRTCEKILDTAGETRESAFLTLDIYMFLRWINII